MKKKLLAFGISLCLFSSVTYAHVQNEYTIYEDVNYSDAKEELLQLRALGVIPNETGASVFTPQANLDTLTLNFWSSSYRTSIGETSAIISENKPATYTDIVKAYWGEESLTEPVIQEAIKGKETDSPTKEEAVFFLASFIDPEKKPNLLNASAIQEGPTGVITDVTKKSVEEDEKKYEVYQVVINGKTYPLTPHPKALYGPTEIEKWKGKTVARSWIETKTQTANETPTILYIEAQKDAFPSEEYAPVADVSHSTHVHEEETKDDKQGFPVLLTLSVIGALLLLVAIFRFTRKP